MDSRAGPDRVVRIGAVRREVGLLRLAGVVHDVEALRLRIHRAVRPVLVVRREMPLAEQPGRVAPLLEPLGQRPLRQRQTLLHPRRDQRLVLPEPARDVVGEAEYLPDIRAARVGEQIGAAA
jgi:hypothetical protein